MTVDLSISNHVCQTSDLFDVHLEMNVIQRLPSEYLEDEFFDQLDELVEFEQFSNYVFLCTLRTFS